MMSLVGAACGILMQKEVLCKIQLTTMSPFLPEELLRTFAVAGMWVGSGPPQHKLPGASVRGSKATRDVSWNSNVSVSCSWFASRGVGT